MNTEDCTATLRLTYLSMCDNNYCAAMLLDWLYAEADNNCQHMNPEEPDESVLIITATVERLTAFQLFSYEDADSAIELLIDKGYIETDRNRRGMNWTFYVSVGKINPNYWKEWEQLQHQRQEDTEKSIQQQRLETKRVTYHLKRAETLALPATLTLQQWLATLEYFEWQCAYCQQAPYQIFEHFMPLFHGGGTTYNNCVPACASCNCIKSDLHPSVFKDRLKNFEGVQDYLRLCGSEIA